METGHTAIGIDLGRRSKHEAVLVREGGDPQPAAAKPFAFAHDREGLVALRDRVCQQIDAPSLEGTVVNMEATSGVWEAVAGFLRAQGARVCFTRTDVVAQLRKVHSKFAKTNRIDARTLAGVPWSFPEKLVPTVTVERRIRGLRELSAQRQRLVEEITRWKNRLVAKLELVWTPLLAQLTDDQRFSQLARAFFRRFTDPRKVVRLGRERFLAWCRQKAHGRTRSTLFETFWHGAVKSTELWDLLEDCRAIQVDWESLRDLIAQDLRLLAHLERERRTLDARIRQAREDVPEADVVQQLPGVGPVVSTTLAALLLPVTRFANAKKCGAYTGYTSRRKGTGNRLIEGLKITKTGNRRLKRDLALAADTAMHQDAQLAAFAIRLLRAGKHYNKVRVAVGRKLALRAYSLLKRYANGQTDVAYVWRDLRGHTLTKHQAKTLAQKLWADYRAEIQRKGSSPDPAGSWQRERSTQQTPNELPTQDHAPLTNHKSNPKRTGGTWGKVGDIPCTIPPCTTAKNP